MAANLRKNHWCFTLNNPTSVQYVKDRLDEEDDARYWIFQMERGDENTLHAQGYVEFTDPQRLGAVKKVLRGAHWEGRRGTRDEARDYCRKLDSRLDPPDGPYEGGDWRLEKRGRRTDLIRLREAAHVFRAPFS